MRSQPNTQFSIAIKEYIRSQLEDTFQVGQGSSLPKSEEDELAKGWREIAKPSPRNPTKVDLEGPEDDAEEEKVAREPRIENPLTSLMKERSRGERRRTTTNRKGAFRRKFSPRKGVSWKKKSGITTFGLKTQIHEE